MNKVKIITDSCCSLSENAMKELGVDYVQMGIVVGNESFDSFNYPIKNPEEFYKNLEKVKKCSTSCVNTQTFADIFEKNVKDGFDVFYVGLSGGLSSTYQNALNAQMEINEAYGEHVFVADSLTGSYGIAIMVLNAVQMAKDGKSAKEIYDAIEKNNMKVFSIFMPGDLQFLMRCGRINPIVANIGSVLKIVPIISPDERGKLKTIGKCLGHKKALKTLENYVLDHCNLERAETIYIAHTGQKESAELLANTLKEKAQNKNFVVDYIDYTMGCCCGPNTIAVFGFEK